MKQFDMIKGWIVQSYDGFQSIMSRVHEEYATGVLEDICNAGYIFEGLQFDKQGHISNLYFRRT